MVKVFWDADGVFLFDFVDSGRANNDDYYASWLEQVLVAITQQCNGKLNRGVRLLQDNAPSHKIRMMMKKSADSGSELLSHPPYSPDLAHSDYHLFKYMKKHLRGRTVNDKEKKKIYCT